MAKQQYGITRIGKYGYWKGNNGKALLFPTRIAARNYICTSDVVGAIDKAREDTEFVKLRPQMQATKYFKEQDQRWPNF